MKMLYMAHSGVRYLVILFAVLAIVGLVLGFTASRRSAEGPSAGQAKGIRIATASFVGVLDLQVILGIVLLVLMMADGRYYPALIGHIIMMILAAVVAHVGSVLGRRRTGAGAYSAPLFGVLTSLALVVGGIMAIGRGVMETTPFAG